MVDEFFVLINVTPVSFVIEEVDALRLVSLAHAIPLHADGLCIVYVDAVILAPGTESGHLLAGGVAQITEVAPHIVTEQVIQALAQSLLAIGGKIIVCLRILILGGRDANGHRLIRRLVRKFIAWALGGKSADDSILIAGSRKDHGVAERVGEPLSHVWLDIEVDNKFAHEINVEISPQI